MVRVIFLLQKDAQERIRLINATLNGEKWKIPGANGKMKNVTDKEMVEIAQGLQGWTQSVYKFGCAFIHLSDHHNHYSLNPFDLLTDNERQDILGHMRHYHFGPHDDNSSMEELAEYIPMAHDKVASNLERYLKDLEEMHEETQQGASPDAFGAGEF